ncbi:hypothetical protein NA57DRAFT_61335 [Rhizodiscina lignyota]|uniref:Transmembrane protein n=1 Tax=Rhizodiscina lignyota TaxID=1504668 RepID=A0A9P4I4G8_9PEZI|nr:hypothetical protein NA57DRAFT_61335 [Rhizodiscina lignyota]
MAVVRDPSFWRRFSMAVHLDEEHADGAPATSSSESTSSSRSRPQLKHAESWLERQQKKSKRRTCICWLFWMCFFGFVAGVVIVVLWLKTSGLLDGKHDGRGSAAQAANTVTPIPGTGQGNGMGGTGR